MDKTRTPRIVVAGYGAIGRHHARNLASMPEANLVGIVDPLEAARAEATSAGHRVFAGLGEALACDLDAVILSVPTSLHFEYGMECLAAKCAILVEKPIASTSAQGLELIHTAASAKLPLMVGYVERYNPAVVAARNFINDGNLGRILGISARRVGTMPARIKDANVLIDIGVHDIDLAAFVLDCNLHLRSAQGGRAVLDDRLDYAFLALDGGGVPIHIESNWITPVKIRELFITGENGLCHIDYVTQQTRFAAARHFSTSNTFEGTVEQYVAGQFTDLPVEREEPLRRELLTFIAGMANGSLPDPMLSLVSLRIAEEATAQIDAQHVAV